MKMPIYSVRDVKVGFMAPYADQSEASAVRGFSYAINGNNGLMNFSPKDFDLYEVGLFDTDTGTIESCIPVIVVTGTGVFGVDK